MDKSNICFIRAKQKSDYVVSGIQKTGYKVIIPYRDYNLFFRVCREIWFRLRLPYRRIWVNPEIKKLKESIIIVKDPLIVSDFMEYLRQENNDKTIIFDYDNRVSNSISPDSIRQYVDEIWHYDKDDCKEYGLRFKGYVYLDIYCVKNEGEHEFDVFYVGRDKGRLTKIESIQKSLNDAGLKTYFHICANREFLTWTNKKYKHFLPYQDYLKLLKKSRAILNIVPDGQKSITQREMEAVFDGVKCITNNIGVKDFPLYDESRFYILDNNFAGINQFLNSEFKTIPDSELEDYKFVSRLENMLRGQR